MKLKFKFIIKVKDWFVILYKNTLIWYVNYEKLKDHWLLSHKFLKGYFSLKIVILKKIPLFYKGIFLIIYPSFTPAKPHNLEIAVYKNSYFLNLWSKWFKFLIWHDWYTGAFIYVLIILFHCTLSHYFESLLRHIFGGNFR